MNVLQDQTMTTASDTGLPPAIVHGWFFVPYAALGDEDGIKAEKQRLTFVPKFADENDPPVRLYRDLPSKGYLGVPRAYGLHRYPWLPQDDRTTDGLPFLGPIPRLPDPHHPAVKEPERQAAFMQDLLNAAQTQKSFVAQASTGSGKTVCALWTAAQLGRKTLILVHLERLQQQWLDEIRDKLGLPDERIGIVQGPSCQWEDRDFVVGMMPSLSQRSTYPREFYQSFGTVIFDECFHPDHEFLTRRGWVSVKDVTEQDEVAQWDDGVISFVRPERLVRKPFSGCLVLNDHPAHRTLTTPNHEQPIMWRKKSGEWVQGRRVCSDMLHSSYIRLPVTGAMPMTGEGMTAEDRLRVAFHDDGCIIQETPTLPTKWVRFMFRRGRKVARLRAILDDLGIDYSVSQNSRGDVSILFKTDIPLEKNLEWVGFHRSGRWYAEFVDEVAEWDGWRSGDAVFYEQSGDMARSVEIVRDAMILSGYQTSITEPKREGNRSSSLRVRGTHYRTHYRSLKTGSKSYVQYSGEVFCVTVPAGNVLTRYHGVVSVSGNCHRVGSPMLSRCASMFPAKVRIGLSATPHRKDGGDRILFWHLGPIAVKSSATALECTVYVKRYRTARRLWGKNHQSRAKCLSQDPDRNAMLVDLIERNWRVGRNILVIGKFVAHLQDLMDECARRGIPVDQMAQYTGEKLIRQRAANGRMVTVRKVKVTKAEYESAKQNAKVIFATYGVFKEGIDIPRLDCGIDVLPQSEATQVIGRIRRPMEGKPKPYWITILDEACSLSRRMFDKRMQDYTSTGCRIVDNNKV